MPSCSTGGLTSSRLSLSGFAEWGKIEGCGRCARAPCPSTTTSSEAAHMRHEDDPGLFPAPQFGQVIISLYSLVLMGVAGLIPAHIIRKRYFSWKQKSDGRVFL